jgi:hypothetical protein
MRFPSAGPAKRALIRLMAGIIAMLSFRGKIAVRTIVASGAFSCITRRIA